MHEGLDSAPATAAPAEGEPRWVRDLGALWLTEIRLFASTVSGFVRRPRRFGAEWASGRLRAMNPLGVVAASWPLLLPLDYGIQRLLGWDRRQNLSIWVEIARAARPYLFVLPIGMLLYVAFRALGSRRRLSTTMGVLLYWMALSSAFWLVGLLGCLLFPVGHRLPMAASGLSLIWGAFALAGVHRVGFLWSFLALLLSSWISISGVNALLAWIRLT